MIDSVPSRVGCSRRANIWQNSASKSLYAAPVSNNSRTDTVPMAPVTMWAPRTTANGSESCRTKSRRAGSNDATRVTTSTRVIAIDTPNDNSLNTSWGTYRTSVDAIEAATGLDILSAVPTGVQQTIEARIDSGPTS